MTGVRHAVWIVLAGAALVGGCGDGGEADPCAGAIGAAIEAKWGKPLSELPTVSLVLISPHNESIQNEYEWAFSLHHAMEHGKKVDLQWRDVGSGSGGVLRYLQNIYANSDTAEIDIVWGGGDYTFIKLADAGILQPMTLDEGVLANIPGTFGGLTMHDPNGLWCGSALSGFGFLYNRSLLERLEVQPPEQWQDLGGKQFFNRIALADPTQSGSAAAAYEMIVQSGSDWPDGWARLLDILSNAKRFVDSASGAANAPGLGEAPVATCIDFYGILRVAEAPDHLAYVSPKGQTAFNPDPIAILKNPPNPELAQRFVDFVLSQRGQALWFLKVGDPQGPVRNPLGRQPIRRDVYDEYAGRILPRIVNPYEAGTAMKLDIEQWNVRYGVLRQLVKAAAVDNRTFLQNAKRRLIETGFEPERVAEFHRLPSNVATFADIAATAEKLRDRAAAERVTTDWQRYFRDKYVRVARE